MCAKREAGFTLAELMVAVLLLVVGVLAVASIMATATLRQVRSTVVTEMTALAESKVEELRAHAIYKSADTVQVSLGGSLTTSEADHADTVTSPVGRPYIRRWLIEAGVAGTRRATLRIASEQQSRVRVPAMDFPTLLLVVR
ncbi:MAG: prepilin-type N-terminal cleavage/methylation domain-containing protein [Gemmatimonadetes bacterium]|nr:prepilin-type N-terminal cleavage/methylation domain-containing protein [Gemmatimonadota bacterium]MBI2402867.1 prepilin-type N-terminal cleavage/methylation domain-containing protein [Gemmatimonadota bacterium]